MPVVRISKKTSKFVWKNRNKILGTILFLLLLLSIFSYLTNPFTHYSIVDKNFVEIEKVNNNFVVKNQDEIYVKNNKFYQEIATAKSGWHIFINRLDPRSITFGSTVSEIIQNIHNDRFANDAPFLISGEHFSVLYPRSLGIFYHTILDPRIALNKQDWENKQIITLKTLALILETFSKSKKISTTIVPISPHSVTLINIYAPPSDTLFSILFALKSFQTSEMEETIYPFETGNRFPLQTKNASQKFLTTYHDSLGYLINQYNNQIYDKSTGLVKKNIYLSSTKDSVKRQSSFYDNVIFWKTNQLAQEMGIKNKDPEFLKELKQRIISTFWLENEGYFLDELSPESVQNKWYSSDWLIAYEVGFLDPNNPRDLELLKRSVNYIIQNKIDEPFGIRYQNDVRPKQLYRAVRTFAREYGSTAIWSHWGMEYTKLLIRLSQVTGNQAYLDRAGRQLEAYKFNIEKYGGFPEVYKENGDIFKTKFYEGIRSTGWIVNYEQAVAMYSWTKGQLR